MLAVPASAAFADAPPSGHPAATPTLQAHVRSRRLAYGRALVVTGRAPAAEAGQPVALEYAPAGTSGSQQIASARIGESGGFRLSAPLRSSGQVQVTATAQAATASAVSGSAADTSSSAPQRVDVAAALRLRRHTRSVLGAGTFAVHGTLIPARAGRRVQLQVRRGGRWITVAATRTRSSGRFGVRYRLSSPGRETLRVRYAGDRTNAAVSRPAGEIVVLRPSAASWYQDGGNTACGFHAYYGVANLSLPCGARVAFSYGGRTVTATVDDRGPYAGGREWDLNRSTAAALGFGGVGTVWSSS